MSQPDIEFEWSYEKAEINLRKHGIGFEEAEAAFDDHNAFIQEDELHSDAEPREVLLGYSSRNRLLVVSFIQRSHNLIRIISARLASRKEHRIYEETPRY